MIFGKKIKELREEQGMLQRQLAAVIEVDTPLRMKSKPAYNPVCKK